MQIPVNLSEGPLTRLRYNRLCEEFLPWPHASWN
jgi:hypothetical protein